MTVEEYKREFTKIFKDACQGFKEEDLDAYINKLDFENMLDTDLKLYGEPRYAAAASEYALMYPDM
ncbi:hypothetical protein J6S88_07745 [bacterium]|nr:hypothetical protein [bacterium]